MLVGPREGWYCWWTTRVLCLLCCNWRLENGNLNPNETRSGPRVPAIPLPAPGVVHYAMDDVNAACGATRNFPPLARPRPAVTCVPADVTCVKCRAMVGC